MIAAIMGTIGAGFLLHALFASSAIMLINFLAYSDRPVVLKTFGINTGYSSLFSDLVVEGKAETAPRGGAGGYLVGYRKGWGSRISLEATWIELSSGMAWRATADVSSNDMERGGSGEINVSPIFAPGGLMIISSDPIPLSADDMRTKDLARICGKRVPELDQDYSNDRRQLAGLWEAFERLNKSPYQSECQT